MGTDGISDDQHDAAAVRPPIADVAEQAHTEAVVRAFGSNEVREHMETWRDLVRQVI